MSSARSERKTALGEAMTDAAKWRYEASRFQAALARARRGADQLRQDRDDWKTEAMNLRAATAALRTDDSWYRDGLDGWPDDKRDGYAAGFSEAADYIEQRVDGDG